MRANLFVIAAGLAVAASQSVADVRVIHASPDAPNVDVYVNGEPGVDDPPIMDLAFTQATPYIPLPTDTYNFKVTPTGLADPVVIDADAEIDGDTFYTIAAVNFLDSIEPLILVDDNTSFADMASIRFVHASPDAPAVDIAVADGGPTLFSDVEFKENGGDVQVPGGSYDLEVLIAGTEDVVLEVPGLAVDNGAVYSIFAEGSVGAETLTAVPYVDVIPAPGAAALLGLGALVVARRRR